MDKVENRLKNWNCYAVVKSLNPAVKKNFPPDFGQVWCGQGTVSMWWATCDKYARHWGSSSQCLRMEHKTYLKPPTSCSIVLPCYTPPDSPVIRHSNGFFSMVFLPREPLNARSFEEIRHILFCPYSFSDKKKWFRCVFLLAMAWLVLIRSRFWPRLGAPEESNWWVFAGLMLIHPLFSGRIIPQITTFRPGLMTLTYINHFAVSAGYVRIAPKSHRFFSQQSRL